MKTSVIIQDNANVLLWIYGWYIFLPPQLDIWHACILYWRRLYTHYIPLFMRSHQTLIYIPAPVYYRVQLVEQSEIFLLYWEHVVFTTCSYVGGIPFISHIFNPLFILVLFCVATPTAIWLTMLRRSLILFWPSSLILPLFHHGLPCLQVLETPDHSKPLCFEFLVAYTCRWHSMSSLKYTILNSSQSFFPGFP